ncbi:recombinase family protein [Paraburkholderia sp. BR14374]|uniref:recombinase family protein n=1 Tax=Paraburkholderia sp. BR14374 TaxID=3237007 RepID=UPI0034CFB2EA
MNTRITPQHQSKPAYIYIRQSTLAQVRHHQESTERQYALRDKALALGSPETAIRVLDRDLGQSGAQLTGREDFKTLVADVSMGNVGAVFALEVSRLARSNLGLASPARVVRAHPYARDRRRWLLRRGGTSTTA